MPDAQTWLDDIAVESPCAESWDAMTGDECVRRCAVCRLDVHDLSALTRTEAEALLRTTEGRLCARVHRRPDGRVLTRDCVPARRRVARRRTRVRVLLAGLLGLVGLAGCRHEGEGSVTMGVILPEKDWEEMYGAPPEGPAPAPVAPEGAATEASCG